MFFWEALCADIYGGWLDLCATLLVVAMSAKLGHRTRLATAEASPPTQETLQMAQHPAPEGSRDRWNRPSQLSQC